MLERENGSLAQLSPAERRLLESNESLRSEIADPARLSQRALTPEDRALPGAMTLFPEGTLDATTLRGKAPFEVARRCARSHVLCVIFAGRIVEAPPEFETIALSGDPSRARQDLVALGRRLGVVSPSSSA